MVGLKTTFIGHNQQVSITSGFQFVLKFQKISEWIDDHVHTK